MSNEPPPQSAPELAPPPLPSFRGQPKSMDEIVGRLASGHHNGGRRPPRTPIAWASIGIGIASIVAAVAFFAFGLMVGFLLFFPPVLLGFGFLAILKGLLGQRAVE